MTLYIHYSPPFFVPGGAIWAVAYSDAVEGTWAVRLAVGRNGLNYIDPALLDGWDITEAFRDADPGARWATADDLTRLPVPRGKTQGWTDNYSIKKSRR